MASESFDIVLLYPELLGLYGDRGNALALAHRARLRGIDARIVEVPAGSPIPQRADVYLVGGGEDASLMLAHGLLGEQPGLARALRRGAPCLAVCAGFQLLSVEFAGPDGTRHAGQGVIDARCGRLPGARAVGEVAATALARALGPITGYENHQGDAVLGESAVPLGRVSAGTGNGHDRAEGAVQGNVFGTYLHGPVLVRNPRLADHLIRLAVGTELEPIDDADIDRLRSERFRASRSRFARASLLGNRRSGG